ncbi:hypothetical protein DL95DRAFT_461848 [Leptodontidium sp. 2 PMI_412]|nr:hypothetical protein BKA61DRAFT_740103 [Leptodontidium sp. MPI-SDFR-AT-0119]KAH9214783.1 hypothetical protein DL95DRAFT_461848 [Leptodontidium sp. 2 PMI_412]
MPFNKESSRLTRLLLLILVCLSVFAQAQTTETVEITISAPTSTSTAQPITGLGIRQDKSAVSQRNFVWTSKLRYDSAVSTLFNDDDLYALAKQAWDEMQTDIAARRPVNGRQNADTILKKDEPGMMGLIAVGNTIYLASSMKGGKFIYGYTGANGQPAQVALALDRCQMALRTEVDANVSPHHTNKASCAEILAMHQYYLDPAVSAADKSTLPAGMRAAAYGDGGNKKRGAKPYEPCAGKAGDATTWGCSQFLGSMKIVAPPLPSGTLSNPTTVPVEITYVPVCES